MNALSARRAAMRAADALAGPEVAPRSATPPPPDPPPPPPPPEPPPGEGFTFTDDLPESDDEIIARLAQLSELDYERVREAEAERMRARPGILDRLVKVARAKAAPPNDKAPQGRALTMPAPAPWPSPVDGADLLDRLAGFFARHIFLPPAAQDAMAAWTLHSHSADLARHSPRLAFTSPEKRCGKTTALDALALVVAKPLATANVSAAALFRVIEAAGPTLLIDEADTFLRDNEDLRGLLNAGHKRGGQVIRCVGDDLEPRAFGVFGPAAIAAIGRLPGTIEDRAIMIRMARARRAERPERIGPAAEAEGAAIGRQCARWCADHAEGLRDADPSLPRALFNRQADNWRPLFAIAEAAGGVWPERLAAAAGALIPDDDDAEGRGVRLLADVRAAFDRQGVDRLSSAALCEALTSDPTSPWADFKHGKPIGQAQLAAVLRDFKIIPGTVRLGTVTAKGYARAAFAEAWSRYVGEPSEADPRETPPEGGFKPSHRHNPQKSAPSGIYRADTETNGVTGRESPNPAYSAACDGVTVSHPLSGGSVEDGPAEGGWEADL